MWRFPFLVHSNGGGAFVLIYLLIMVLVGIPLCSMELVLGQFTSRSPARCYEFCPLFEGVGFSTLVISMLARTYYSVITSWSLLYFFKSFTSKLPWAECDRKWATDFCWDYLIPSNVSACNASGWAAEKDGACYNTSVIPKRITALWNVSLATENGIDRVLPAKDYMLNEVLGVDKEGVGLTHLGELNMELVGCLFFTWSMMCLSVITGLKSLTKMECLTMIYCTVVLLILFGFGFTLDGAIEGITCYLTPDLSKLLEVKVWEKAVGQVFYTLSISASTLVGLASYNVFNSDPVLHAVILAVANASVSLMSGFVVFTSLGYVSQLMDIELDQLHAGGTTLVFVIYPVALTRQKYGQFLSCIYYLMIFCWALSTSIGTLQVFFGALYDLFPLIRNHRKPTRVLMCMVYFLVCLPMVTDAGLIFVNILNFYLYSFNIFIMSLLTVTAVTWVYGLRHFLVDVEVMIGVDVLHCVPWAWGKYYLSACWLVLSPACLVFTCVQQFIGMEPPARVDHRGHLLGLGLSWLTLLPIPLAAIYSLLRRSGTLLQRLRAATTPSEMWGPASIKHRKIWLSVYAGKLGEHTQTSVASLKEGFKDLRADEDPAASEEANEISSELLGGVLTHPPDLDSCDITFSEMFDNAYLDEDATWKNENMDVSHPQTSPDVVVTPTSIGSSPENPFTSFETVFELLNQDRKDSIADVPAITGSSTQTTIGLFSSHDLLPGTPGD
ncbi:sodium-dependent proline transporter-like [Littorina saxatilis]|uniref:sodium-dependent proline transporter-like n=1 Tax=Littorina saxatilis TaxID=31220 RepID=UPI0038B59112